MCYTIDTGDIDMTLDAGTYERVVRQTKNVTISKESLDSEAHSNRLHGRADTIWCQGRSGCVYCEDNGQ